jgi:hypothetical protein
MAKQNSLNHALHNEQVCKFLDKKPEFTDWVITTAFYSARHFVEHKLFPFSITRDGKKVLCASFKEYMVAIRDSTRPHNKISSLVEKYLPDIAPQFNQLKDLSFTARYHQYQYSRTISNAAKENLKEIKSFCS